MSINPALMNSQHDHNTVRPQWRPCDHSIFEIDHYQKSHPFASFLPGVGGFDGSPLWCMYVNRGQAVCSFGYQDKNHAISEFFSSTWAYQLVPLYGFRTFIQEKGGIFHEPFSSHDAAGDSSIRTMRIQPHAISLVDKNRETQLKVEVEYCTVSNSLVPALCRKVRITNLSADQRQLRVADGLPVIVPAGINDFSLKHLRRITEGFVRSSLHSSGAALYYVPVTMSDEAKIESVEEVVFYGAWMQKAGKSLAMPMAVDPDAFFGTGSNLQKPDCFLKEDFNLDHQMWMNRLPCAIAYSDLDLGPGETVEIVVYSGFAENPDLLDQFTNHFCSLEAQQEVIKTSKSIIDQISEPGMASTSLKELNGYVRQNFLDNLLRGGLPTLFPSLKGEKAVHVFTRRHGDLERDYNDFQVPPIPYSEGSGNFRDILQNRRHDSWFYPQSGTHGIRTFMELVQADGYNPLSVEGFRWEISNDTTAESLYPMENNRNHLGSFVELVTSPFTPGELYFWLLSHGISKNQAPEKMHQILEKATATLSAKADSEGYWIDHWVYLIDMLEAYEAVYPDLHQTMLMQVVGWFEPQYRVLPRKKRYVLQNGRPRQYGSLCARKSTDRKVPWPATSIMGKLLTLVALKAITLDPEGRGVEMEAGRPGWNDALNGLPGLFGSAVGETAAVARLCRHLLKYIDEIQTIKLPNPVARFLPKAISIVGADQYSWEDAAILREKYREDVYAQQSVTLETVEVKMIRQLLLKIENRCLEGVEKARRPNSPLINSYFYRNSKLNDEELVCDSIPEKIQPKPLPLFLEGQVHLLRLAKDQKRARRIFQAIKESPLYDQHLKTYILNEDLSACSQEIGRIRTFTRGIYENESVWLHMAYKLLVELLRHGLYDEFFEEAQTVLVPFLDPECYGRSIFENSSYVVSSSCPDQNIHGRGFVARLSGSTAEFIHIWLHLVTGYHPFTLEQNELTFRLKPVLPAQWFTTSPSIIEWKGGKERIPANSFASSLFGDILLVYRNESRLNTWGNQGVTVQQYIIDGNEYSGSKLSGEIVHQIRNHQIGKIEALLG